jgi:diguanylate cyclase (GGDEF)-like protein/PAS domain S-box-containing protein
VNDPVKILMVEDSVTDAELIIHGLVRDGLMLDSRRVETRDKYLSELKEFRPHLILSDFSLPRFDGLSALEIAHEMYPDIPFIFVSGTIDEDTAVAALRGGAIDYVSKNNLKRLAPAVQRALEDVRTCRARAQAESRFRDLIEFAPNAIVVINEHGTIEVVNALTETLFGYERDEMLGHPCGMLFQDCLNQWHASFKKSDHQNVQTKPLVGFESTGRRKSGIEFPAEVNLTPLNIDSGMWLSGVIRDISERKAQEKRVACLNRIQTVLSNINAAGIRIRDRDVLCQEACQIAVKDGQFELAWIGMMNPGSSEGTLVAWDGGQERYKNQVRLTTDSTSLEGKRPACQAIRQKVPVICNDIPADSAMAAVLENAVEGGYRSVAALPLIIEEEAIGVMVLYAKDADFFNQDVMVLLKQLAADISFALEHQKNQDKLSYLAYFDSVTDLPNRSLFQNRLRHLLAQNELRHAVRIALVLIDIDRFRNINDTLGRSAGNMLLREVGSRVRDCALEPDYVARIDADCFACIVKCNLNGAEVIEMLEHTLPLRLAEPVHLVDKEIRISFKAGVAMFPLHGAESDALLRNAEAALYNAKLSKLRYLFYNAELNARVAEKLSLENRLKQAWEHAQFVLHYQPKIDLASGKLVGLEALIRWNDPGLELVSPSQFVPVLEDTGLIIEVGRWVIAQAHRQFQEWAIRGLAPPRIAVNVSQLQIRQRNFVSQVLHLMDGAYPDELEFEITESLFMEDLDENIEKLNILRKAGITVAIDDFGTGYSSLSYLGRLPIDTLKIDRSFIEDMRISSSHMAIVSTIISLAQALNLKVVAEGVETAEQLHLLKLLRCDQIQGFVFSRPLPVAEVEAMLVRLPVDMPPPA